MYVCVAGILTLLITGAQPLIADPDAHNSVHISVLTQTALERGRFLCSVMYIHWINPCTYRGFMIIISYPPSVRMQWSWQSANFRTKLHYQLPAWIMSKNHLYEILNMLFFSVCCNNWWQDLNFGWTACSSRLCLFVNADDEHARARKQGPIWSIGRFATTGKSLSSSDIWILESTSFICSSCDLVTAVLVVDSDKAACNQTLQD